MGLGCSGVRVALLSGCLEVFMEGSEHLISVAPSKYTYIWDPTI